MADRHSRCPYTADCWARWRLKPVALICFRRFFCGIEAGKGEHLQRVSLRTFLLISLYEINIPACASVGVGKRGTCPSLEIKGNKLSCCCDSRSYCLRSTVYWQTIKPVSAYKFTNGWYTRSDSGRVYERTQTLSTQAWPWARQTILAKASVGTNGKLLARSTLVQVLALYTDLGNQNAQTDRRTDGRQDDANSRSSAKMDNNAIFCPNKHSNIPQATYHNDKTHFDFKIVTTVRWKWKSGKIME